MVISVTASVLLTKLTQATQCGELSEVRVHNSGQYQRGLPEAMYSGLMPKQLVVDELACAGAVLLSAVLGLEWLGLKVCICKFFCNDGWRQKYTYGQSGWNGE